MIEINTIEDIELLSESSDLECKLAAGRDGKGVLPNEFWETYSAMANTDGGTVILGLKQKGTRFELKNGVEQHEKVTKELFDTANNLSKASINLLSNSSVRIVTIEGKNLIVIEIRRASREERPVYLNGNPLGNTYVRLHEGDQRQSNEATKRMLAEQAEDSRDNRILKGFDIDDLNTDSLRIYRQIFTNRDPNHPWNELDRREFLQRIGGWRKDREEGISGLTAAGLLMFGNHTAIQEAYPNYMLDYQERPRAKTERRWIDRITLDGTWSGNLYDFYRKVYPKLTEGLKTPFELSDDQRIDDSPIHVAIREALCNVLVHADYTDRCSVLVVKRPDLFGFRNPGMMRIPIDYALQGGHPDCRNRLLHQMFRYVGIGDQAGSGIPKIMQSWVDCHWRPPELADSREPFEQTILRMRMVDLLPKEIVVQLSAELGEAFTQLNNFEQIALVIASVENTVTHQRLSSLANIHPADTSRCLRELVRKGLLSQTGSSRGAVYHITGADIPGPEDVFGNSKSGQSSPIKDQSSPINEPSSPISGASSPNIKTEQGNSNRDAQGRLISNSHTLPFVDDLEILSEEYRTSLEQLASEPRSKKRLNPEAMKATIKTLSEGHYITIACLAILTTRDAESLRSLYLSKMVKDGVLEIAFPRTPNDPRQAYTLSQQ